MTQALLIDNEVRSSSLGVLPMEIRVHKIASVVHRLNLHYFVQARENNTKVYSAAKPHLCKQWIRRHADLYFTDMSASLPSASDSDSDSSSNPY